MYTYLLGKGMLKGIYQQKKIKHCFINKNNKITYL